MTPIPAFAPPGAGQNIILNFGSRPALVSSCRTIGVEKMERRRVLQPAESRQDVAAEMHDGICVRDY